MLLLEIALLAIIQGIGEFLPISSSGHVVVLAALFDQVGFPLTEKLTVNIVLHLGTLFAILVFYRHRIIAMLGRDRRVIALLLVGSLPAAVAGLGLRYYCQDALENALVAGLMFLVTGAMLLWTKRGKGGKLVCRELKYSQSLLIGVFQSLALLPGISRSGSTIVAGLVAGLDREEAAAFSFLLAIPAIAGAGLIEFLHLSQQPAQTGESGALLMGATISFGVGYVSLQWLISWLAGGKLHWFACWLFLLGPAVVVWQVIARWYNM